MCSNEKGTFVARPVDEERVLSEKLLIDGWLLFGICLDVVGSFICCMFIRMLHVFLCAASAFVARPVDKEERALSEKLSRPMDGYNLGFAWKIYFVHDAKSS
jgi:hypothetical protein